MWPFKRKKARRVSPEQLDEARALNAFAAGRTDTPLDLAGGLAAAGAFDRERLLEKADDADETS